MKIFRKKSFREVYSLNCRITNFFGYFYFSVHRIENERRRKVWEVLNWIRFAVFIVFGLWSFGKTPGIDLGSSSNSIIVSIGLELLVKQFMYTPLALRIMTFALRRQHEKILLNIDAIDLKFSKLHIAINHRKEFVFIVCATVIQNVFVIGALAFDHFISLRTSRPKPLNTLLLVGFAVLSVFNYQLCYICLVNAMYRRLHSINQYLESKDLNQSTLHAIGCIQLQVDDTLELINRNFFVLVVNYFPKYIVYCIFFIFGLCQYFVDPSPPKLLFVRIWFGYVVTIFWFGAFFLPVASWVGSESRKMKSLINSKTNCGSAKYLNDFCLQLEHVTPKVNCGLFVVDWNLLFVFVGTVFSYLVILVQFESGKFE